MIVAVVVTEASVASARETIRAVLDVDRDIRCEVLDLSGGYRALADESITPGHDVGRELDALRLTLDDTTFLTASTALWSAHLLVDQPVLGLVPGVLLQGLPAWGHDSAMTVAVARAVEPASPEDSDASLLATEVFVLGTGARPHLTALRRLASDWRTSARWLDLFLARVPHEVVIDDAALVSRANSGPGTILGTEVDGFTRAGVPVVALDLVGLDPHRPWLFDSRIGRSTGPLLSQNLALAQYIDGVASRERHDVGKTGAARPDMDVIRSIARDAADAGASLGPAVSNLETWLLELIPVHDRAPVARYLAGIRGLRPDLIRSFPRVPGVDSVRLARWALDYGVDESAYDAAVLRRAAEATLAAQPEPEKKRSTRPRGVNLIGYLSGELGIGTSARLMDAALEAAQVPTSTFAVSANLQSRASAAYRRSDGTRYDTSLLAVNADQTETVAESLADVVQRSYRIGMWYWEVESFPASRDAAFSHVDEVWVATDFVRDAIAQRAPIPVRTVMPPLPQRSADEPPAVPERLRIPRDRPWFFFAFDYLSTVERKNPLGLIEAFTRAFPPGDVRGPVLVIKTLNARHRVGDAERLRLVAEHRSDVILIDEYLEPDELTALMARCTAYVSLHRAEGLGLTIAEAMAWGRPVVVSAYSGNMQFTNSDNAFLVPCTMTSIPEGAEPYPAGTAWADPDLDAAAALLRGIVEDPQRAAVVGRRAAEDIRVVHSPIEAARRVREALDQARRRRTPARMHVFGLGPILRGLARRFVNTLGPRASHAVPPPGRRGKESGTGHSPGV